MSDRNAPLPSTWIARDLYTGPTQTQPGVLKLDANEGNPPPRKLLKDLATADLSKLSEYPDARPLESEIADRLVTAAVVDRRTGATVERTPGDLDLSYRHSNLRSDEIVVAARFTTDACERGDADERIREITRWRKEHQPGGTFNAGSVFKNPPGDAAGRLIDEAGLKGLRVGGVAVSALHANFFTADQDATAQDVWDLIREVRRRVGEQTGIWLTPEVRTVGPFTGKDLDDEPETRT